MVEFQRLTGCRPGEACVVRREDIDTGGTVWLYKPKHHKTAWRGKSRVISSRARVCGFDLQHVRCAEWIWLVRDDHVLIRVACELWQLRCWIRESKAFAGVRCPVDRIKNVEGMCRYIVKHMKHLDRAPELPPADHRGPVLIASRGYFLLPKKRLWKLVRADDAASKEGGAR
jgi:hypothetical protein